MTTHWLRDRLASFGDRPALVEGVDAVSYAALARSVDEWDRHLSAEGLGAGSVVAIHGDYGPSTVAALLALLVGGRVAVPLTAAVGDRLPSFLDTARAQAVLHFDGDVLERIERRPDVHEPHPLLARIRAEGAPGLVLFSSGSTGRAKASLLNFEHLVEKFREQRRGFVALTFLLLDHIGGINTLMYLLSNGGTVVPLRDRNPRAVCAAIERHGVELLPTTPTFLNMLLISEAHRAFDIGSLELVTYGTEPMPESTLTHLHAALPSVRLKQTYGLSELGILRTRSRDSGSLWVRVGGDGYETKVVDGTLRIKARAAMLGYLNAPSPFDDEGWFDTGDRVQVDGDYLRILGRETDIINVGGEKVYAAEVESVLLEMDGVRDASVAGRANAVTGQVVTARLSLDEPEDRRALRRRIRRFCRGRLEPFKVPVQVEVVQGELHNARFKKTRRSEA